MTTALPGTAYTSEVLAALRSGDPQTLARLSAATGLSRPTLTRATDLLIDAEWVEAREPATAGGAGRPAASYRFRAERGLAIGVEVDVSEVRIRVVDAADRELVDRLLPIDPALGGRERIDAIAAMIRDVGFSASADASAYAVGLAVPVTLDAAGHVTASPTIREWADLDLVREFADRLGCPVLAENTVHLAALAENREGAARDARNFAYFWVQWRVTSAFVIEGRLHRGANGAAGTIGEIDLLGWRGAPDALIGRAARDPEDFADAAHRTLEAARSGDTDAAARVEAFVDGVARGLAALALATDPDFVVLGGIDLAGEPGVRAAIRERIHFYSHSVAPPLVPSFLGERATVRGASSIALDHLATHELGLGPA